MPRKAIVVVILVAALALIAWSGITNYRAHKALQQHAAQQLVLTPDAAGGAGTASANTDALGMPPSPLLGKSAPGFTLEDATGKKVSLSDYKGKAVLLNFWATWCAPCRVETPWLEKFHDQYAAQGLTILGVSTDLLDGETKAKIAEQKVDVVKSAGKLGINYPVLLGGDELSKPYGGLDEIPQSFFIDRTGKVTAVIIGLRPRDEIEADIKKALASGA